MLIFIFFGIILYDLHFKPEITSHTWRAVHTKAKVVQLHDILDNGKPQPGSDGSLLMGLVNFIIAVPHLSLIHI